MWQELLTHMPCSEKGVLAGAPATLSYYDVTVKRPYQALRCGTNFNQK